MKLTALEKKWVLYDVANSAFTLMVSTLIPIYFHSLAKEAGIKSSTYLATWGYAISLSTLLVVLIGPIIGAYSDKQGHKKKVLTTLIVGGSFLAMLLGLTKQWMVFLGIFMVAKVFYQLSLIIYDSTLGDVTTDERIDDVSSQGYAWGYIGSCIPFIIDLVIVLNAEKLGLSMSMAMLIAFVIVGVWWLVMSLPLLKAYKQVHFIDHNEHEHLLSQLGHTLKGIGKNKKVLFFIIAFFFYIDGVYTIIDMSTAYGSALGLDSTGLLLALLVTQFVAFPAAIIFGKLSTKKSASKLITICIIAYFGIAMFAVFMSTQLHFWILAVCVGMFQGGIQALSRSYFTKIIPQERSGEYFSFLDICGKGASILGTLLMSLITQVTGNQRLGVGAIACFFIIGLLFFRISAQTPQSIE